jgi:hypothetical protein
MSSIVTTTGIFNLREILDVDLNVTLDEEHIFKQRNGTINPKYQRCRGTTLAECDKRDQIVTTGGNLCMGEDGAATVAKRPDEVTHEKIEEIVFNKLPKNRRLEDDLSHQILKNFSIKNDKNLFASTEIDFKAD